MTPDVELSPAEREQWQSLAGRIGPGIAKLYDQDADRNWVQRAWNNRWVWRAFLAAGAAAAVTVPMVIR